MQQSENGYLICLKKQLVLHALKQGQMNSAHGLNKPIKQGE